MSSTSAMRQSYSCQSAVDDRSNDMIAQFWPLNSAVACSVSANKLIVDWSHLPSMKALTSKNPYTKNTHVFNITHTIPYAILNQKRSAHPAWISGAPKALLCSMSDHKRLLEFTFNKLLDSAIHKVTKLKNVADVVHLQHRQAQKAFEVAFAYSANLTSRSGQRSHSWATLRPQNLIYSASPCCIWRERPTFLACRHSKCALLTDENGMHLRSRRCWFGTLEEMDTK